MKRAPRPRLRVGEAPMWLGMGDAADRGTQAEPRLRSKKKVCLFVSLILLRPVGQIAAALGRRRPGAPKRPIFSCRLRFPEGGVGGEGWEGAALSCAPLDVRRLGSRAQPAGDPPGAGGAGRSAPAAALSLRLSRRPAFGWALPCAPTVRARRAHLRTGGALEARPGGWAPGLLALFLGTPPRVRPGCVLANCASGIGPGVPPWLAVGFSPLQPGPSPRSHAAASSPRWREPALCGSAALR